MRRLKKALAALLMICVLCPCAAQTAEAAGAELHFSDPSTTVGAEVEINVKFSSSSKMSAVEAELAYDASMLRFVSGDSMTGGNGTVSISGSASGTSAEFTAKFQALAEGTAKITVSSSSAKDSSGSQMDVSAGSSSVKIGPGDPSLITPEEPAAPAVTADGMQVEVDGVQYTITSGFTDLVVPEGFVRSTMTFEGQECEVVMQEVSGECAMYLTPSAGGDADFFLYSTENGSFSPFEQVSIGQERYIVLLRNDGTVDLSAPYAETELTLNGKVFPAWQDTDDQEYYLVYALNSDGQKTLYQYDTVDGTYQRYAGTPSAPAAESTEGKRRSGPWGKVLNFIMDFLDIVAVVGLALFLILVITLIVMAVKLYHRNAELDDLYDEYGIDMEEEEGKKPKQEKDRAKPAKKDKKKKKSRYEDDFDDEDDDFDIRDLDDDGYDDDYDDDSDDEYDEYDGSDDDEDEDGFDEYDDGDEVSQDEDGGDLEELYEDLWGETEPLGQTKQAKPKPFEVDLIDLD